MKERLKKYLPWVAFPAFYVACFAVFVLLTFPFDTVRERIVASFNAKQRAGNGQQELQIDEMSSYWLTGVKLTGVRFLSANPEPGKPPTELKVDEARVRLSLLPLLIGHQNVHFNLTAFQGEVEGSFEVHGKDRRVEVELKDVDLSKVEPLSQVIGLPVEGKLSGTVKLEMPEGRASKGNGSVALEATGVAVGDGKAKLKGALALPRVDVGTLTITADAKDGVLKVTKLAAGGKDLELQGEGRIQMRELAPDSICDLNVRFKVNDAYRTKNDVTKSLFGAPGSSQPALFELADPKVKQSKRSDGFYGWIIRGPLGRLGPESFTPAGGGVTSAPGGSVPGFGAAGGPKNP